MLVTVAEASKIECRSVPFEIMILSEESPPKYPPTFHPHCSANNCMKWRWVNQLYERREAIPPDNALGYCGPARP